MFYRTEEGLVLAFVEPGVWSLAHDEWTFHPANSPFWDTCHRQVFRNHNADRIEPAGLPALPPVPAGTARSWKDQFSSIRDPSLLRGPLLDRVRALGGATAWFVLEEDLYETDFRVHEFSRAFWEEGEARAFIAEHESGQRRYHLRRLTLEAGPDQLSVAEFQVETCDQATLDQVLRGLAT